MNKPLWYAQDFIAAIEGQVIGCLPDIIGGISIDSRSLNKGDAFFAIRGEHCDGHDFAPLAVTSGASLLVVAASQVDNLRKLDVPLVVVPDVLVALEALGRYARSRSKAKIIAVTGSVGKTTTKEALRLILSHAGQVHASPASFNNHWGVPLTLARMPQECNFAVFEIGMNHADEIRPLVKMVRPHVALISCVASVHRAHFSSMEEIATAKAEIFDGVEPDGTVLLNRDDEQFDFLTTQARAAGIENIASFGRHIHADYRLLDGDWQDSYSDCRLALKGQKVQVRIGAPGQHMAINMLSSLAVADVLRLDHRQILPALVDFSAPSGRGARHILHLANGAKCLLLDESYNANPTSMRAALQVLAATRPQGQGRRLAVLGDMLELGAESNHAHQSLAQPLIQANVDAVFLLGQEMLALGSLLQKTDMEVTWRATWQELVPLVVSSLRPGDVISIKSSKSMGSSYIVSTLLKEYGTDNRK